jgi:hypothetical protein
MTNLTQKRVDVNENVTKGCDNTICVIVNHDDQHMVNCLIFACTNPTPSHIMFGYSNWGFQYLV